MSNIISEHLSVAYKWVGRGWTQEIEWLRIEGEVQSQWRRKSFSSFLDDMATKGWQLVATTLLGGSNDSYGCVAYFRRFIDANLPADEV